MNRLAYLPGLVLMFLIAPAARHDHRHRAGRQRGQRHDRCVSYAYRIGTTEVTIGQ